MTKYILLIFFLISCFFIATPVSAYDFTLSVYGNANMDDTINEDDIAFLERIIAGTEKKTQFGDANYDGTINEADISYIQSIIDGDEIKLTIVDQQGVTQTIDTPVKTVAPLMFSPLQLVVQLGAVDKVTAVGNTIESMGDKSLVIQEYPELLDLPKIGTTSDPSNEAIIQADPDLVLGTSHTSKEVSQLVSENTGVPFVYFSCDESFDGEDGAYETWRQLGLLLGNDERNRAEELIRFCDEKINLIGDRISTVTEEEKPLIYMAASAKGDISITPRNYDPIDIAGGHNVAEGMLANTILDQVDLSVEQIVSWNPEIILIHCTNAVSVDDVLSNPAIQSVSAIKNKHVYNTKAWFAGWDPATGLCEVLYFAKLFYPDKFEDLNVEMECNEILKEFYGGSGLYDWMLNNGYDFYTWR